MPRNSSNKPNMSRQQQTLDRIRLSQTPTWLANPQLPDDADRSSAKKAQFASHQPSLVRRVAELDAPLLSPSAVGAHSSGASLAAIPPQSASTPTPTIAPRGLRVAAESPF